MNLDGKAVLLTGGTGSFGKAYAHYLLKNYELKRLVIFSRDEQKHYEGQREFAKWSECIEFVIGDIRDRQKVFSVTKGVDFVIHSAAMKHLPMAEEHPMEAIKTNILGSNNLIEACIENKVSKVVALSTDKAALPINVYGATKLLLERLFISADALKTNVGTRFSVVRYANVFGSKGSVIPLFLKLRESGELPITHPKMTRFSIKMQEGIDLIQFALNQGLGGEIVIPIVPSYTVGDVAKAVCEQCKMQEIGARNAEKMHEVLISEFEVKMTIKRSPYYIITPEDGRLSVNQYCEKLNAKRVSGLTEYSSDTNSQWLSVDEIRNQIANS